MGQLLHPSLVQSPTSIQRMQTVQIPKKHFYFEISFDAGPVFASQIKKLRKRFCWVEPAPLWASSYTHLLYKVQDPFSAWRGPARGVSQVACRNFKMSRVGVLSRLHSAVGNLATYIWLRQSFVAFSFERCRYFLAHVACRNLPWQGLHGDSQIPKQDSTLINFNVTPIVASQIKKIMERICLVEPVPLRVIQETQAN